MKKKKILTLCFAVAFMMLAVGCSKVPTFGGESEEPDTVAAETSAADTEEEVEVVESFSEEDAFELYNTYIDINNVMVGRLYDVIDSYFKYVDFQEEFVLLDEDYWCISNNSSFYEYMELANELVSQKTEKDALDEAYIALYPVMKELATTLDEVEQYTDLKSYVDDDYAKGKEYHAIIWEKYMQYEVLGNTFFEELAIVAEQQRMEDLESLKADGYEATYAIVKMIDTAQQIQDAIYAQGVDDSCLIELDIEALQPLYDQYVEEVQICLNYLADEDAMYEEGFPIHSAYFATFSNTVGESKLALTELFQRVEKQKPVDEFYLNSAFPDDGTIANFDSTVSAIIDDYNKMLSY